MRVVFDWTWYDAFRLLLCTGAMLLAAMMLRMCYVRWRNKTAMLHPAVYISFAGALLILAVQRFHRLGHPEVTWDLWAGLLVVAVGWVGILRRAQLAPLPTLRR